MERSIQAEMTIPVAFARARKVLEDDPDAVFNEVPRTRVRGAKRFRSVLGVDLGGGASLQQEVSVQLGVPRATEARFVLPLTWQATGRKRLLPAFEGELEASTAPVGTALRLVGTYSVPLGAVGRLGDRVVVERFARRSLRALVERLAVRLRSDVERRASSPGPPEQGAVVARDRRQPSTIVQSHPLVPDGRGGSR
jgi:hypothetical protein